MNCPKFKAHPWTTVTFSMKNYIGIQDDRHRLIDHDHKLNEKIADLQYIIQPQFIAIDAITAGEGRMLTPTPFAARPHHHGQQPGRVRRGVLRDHRRRSEHGRSHPARRRARLRHDRPRRRSRSPATSRSRRRRQRAKGFKVGLIRVEKYFEGTNITAYAGPPPRAERDDYCWGGCPGAIEEAIEILRLFDKETDAKMPRLHVVFGEYEGDDRREARREGRLHRRLRRRGRASSTTSRSQIENLYKDRSTLDPHTAKHEDIFAKLATAQAQAARRRRSASRAARSRVAEQVLALVAIAPSVKNPYLDRSNMLTFARAYLGWKARVTLNKLQRKRYQQNGAFQERGQAAPEAVVPPVRGAT